MRRKRIAASAWIVVLLALAGCDKRVPVVHSVGSQRELNTILVYFDRQGIGPVEVVAHESRRGTRWEIRVPEVQVEQARQLLAALDLPRPPEADEAGSSSLIPSPEELAQQDRVRLQRRLEAALEMYAGVVRARVLIAPGHRDPLTGAVKQPPSASVVVRHVVADDADADVLVAPEQVQQIVAGAISGLEPEQVQVSYARVVLPVRAVAAGGPREAGLPDSGGVWGRLRAWVGRYQLPIAGGLVALALACLLVPIVLRRPRAATVAAES